MPGKQGDKKPIFDETVLLWHFDAGEFVTTLQLVTLQMGVVPGKQGDKKPIFDETVLL